MGSKLGKEMTLFTTWKYCLQRFISNNGCLLVNIPEKDKRTRLQFKTNWKLQNHLTNALLQYSWQWVFWESLVGAFFFVVVLTFPSLLQQNYFGKLKPLMASQKSITENNFYGSLSGNLITAKQTLRIQITPSGAPTRMKR